MGSPGACGFTVLGVGMSFVVHVELLLAGLDTVPWGAAVAGQGVYRGSNQRFERKRSEFVTTLNDDRLMASAAIMGDSNQPVNGYSTPAASGTPNAL